MSDETTKITCPICNGSGSTTLWVNNKGWMLSIKEDCYKCHGSGKITFPKLGPDAVIKSLVSESHNSSKSVEIAGIKFVFIRGESND